MIKTLCRDGGWMSGAILHGSLLLMGPGFVCKAQGTGYDGPYEFYADGSRLSDTPEFFWDTELKRLAKDYHPPEKPALVHRILYGSDETVDVGPMTKATGDADAADYSDALKMGEIKAADAQAAMKQHAAVRSFLATTDTATQQTDTLPPEPDSEFADYDRGAFAYRLGAAHWPDARKAWLALLDRPAAQRHYRTVWAAFMLGRLGTEAGDLAAAQWFEKTRQLAGQGFADSLGMAADSYGWEGRSEWKQNHPEKAAPLFLTQLALGDESAVVSLKALIPDRESVDGMLNYNDDLPATTDDQARPIQYTDAEQATMAQKIPADLAAMARDPLLRKLETLHILATESGGQQFFDGQTSGNARSKRWLEVIRSTHMDKVEDAEYLGWMAYIAGDYAQAAHWLSLADPSAPIAGWLRARLELRAGKTADAARSMAATWEALRNSPVYMEWSIPKREDGPDSIFVGEFGGEYNSEYSTMQWASGELGAIQLLRSDFVQALNILVKGHLREDAAYVAERVVTADELKAYVDRMPPPGPKSDIQPWIIMDGNMDDTAWLRYVLARRLVRENRDAEAVPYMPPEYGKLLQKYAESLRNGSDPHLAKAVRADNLSTVAWLTRYDGMEIMGTEVWPDGFDSEGAFEDTDLPDLRMTGKYPAGDGGDRSIGDFPEPVSRREKQRLEQSKLQPDVRFHYRIIASRLALKAAALMADNSEGLADALNKAGQWADERDDKLANQCYDLIEKRCAQSNLGKQIIANHWFIPQNGPWSTALQAQQDALHKQFGIVKDSQ
jgi:hypothetical protein